MVKKRVTKRPSKSKKPAGKAKPKKRSTKKVHQTHTKHHDYKFLVIIVAIIVLIFFVAIIANNNSDNLSGESSKNGLAYELLTKKDLTFQGFDSCQDTDQSVYVGGDTYVYLNNLNSNPSYVYRDTCKNPQELVEYSCLKDKIVEMTYNCVYGCSSNACNK